MLSWFKKRKQRSKTSEEVETAEDVETQQQTTQKQASRKRKEKAPVVSETITVRAAFMGSIVIFALYSRALTFYHLFSNVLFLKLF